MYHSYIYAYYFFHFISFLLSVATAIICFVYGYVHYVMSQQYLATHTFWVDPILSFENYILEKEKLNLKSLKLYQPFSFRIPLSTKQ